MTCSFFDKPHEVLKIKDVEAMYAFASVAYVKAGEEIVISIKSHFYNV